MRFRAKCGKDEVQRDLENPNAVGNAAATVGDGLRSSSTNRRNHPYQGGQSKHRVKIKDCHAPGN